MSLPAIPATYEWIHWHPKNKRNAEIKLQYERWKTRVSPPADKFEASRGEVYQGSGTDYEVSLLARLALLKASYFPEDEEMLMPSANNEGRPAN